VLNKIKWLKAMSKQALFIKGFNLRIWLAIKLLSFSAVKLLSLFGFSHTSS